MPANVSRRRFLCNVKMKPEQAKDLEIFSLGGPSDVISVKSLSKVSGNQFQEAVVIDRVWQTLQPIASKRFDPACASGVAASAASRGGALVARMNAAN